MMEQMKAYQALVEAYLSDCFAENLEQHTLLEAMRYSLLAGGKRVRPVLTLAFCQACGGAPETALSFACALEMIHTSSLIHDDLPCMDNDDYRRGRLTNHKVYGEAGAVLAGDSLLIAAFDTLCQAALPPKILVSAVQELSRAAGPYGMMGGQQLDMEGEEKQLGIQDLELLQGLKTGALIRCACRLGVLAGGGTEDQMAAADAYASSIGLAFQIQDDILDCVGDEALLGKPVGSDEKSGKSTFVTACGIETCRARVEKLTRQAVEALEGRGFQNLPFLQDLAFSLASRDH